MITLIIFVFSPKNEQITISFHVRSFQYSCLSSR